MPDGVLGIVTGVGLMVLDLPDDTARLPPSDVAKVNVFRDDSGIDAMGGRQNQIVVD